MQRRDLLCLVGGGFAATAWTVPRFKVLDSGSSADATQSIQAAHDRCAAVGGGVVVIDKPLVCRSVRPVGEGTLSSLLIWGDNVCFDFGEHGSIEFTYRDNARYRPVIIGGVGKGVSKGLSLHRSRCIDLPVASLAEPLSKGDVEIPYPRAQNARPGDVLFVRSGQLLRRSRWEPDSELVVVKERLSDSVLLDRPLAKNYQRMVRDWGSGLRDDLSSAFPYGVTNVTDRMSRNIELRSPRLRCHSCLQLLSIWSVEGFRSSGGELSYNNLGVGSRDSRSVVWRTPLRHNGGVNGSSYALAPSTGCTDWDVLWDIISEGSNYLHIHEGVARSKFAGSLRMRGTEARSAGLSILAHAYDLNISADIDTGSSQEAGVIVQGLGIENLVFGCLTVRNDSMRGSAIRVDEDADVRFSTPPRLLGKNRVFKKMGVRF